MQRTRQDSKEFYIERIMEAVIELEMTKGHLKWRMSDLARVSRVTRSLLYYYFGKDTREILHQAVTYYIMVFLEFRVERMEKIKRGEVLDLIAVARKRLRKNPYFLQFYAKHRLEETDVSPLFRKAEKHYYENLKETLSPKWRSLARILWALIFGLAVQPSVSDDDLKAAEAIVRRAWPKK